MMSILEVSGNLLKSDDDVIIHGCNCFNKMAKGIAGQISRKYPGAMLADLQTIKGDHKKLGTYTMWTGKNIVHDKQITIINAYTQYRYGNYDIYVEYSAITEVMKKIKEEFRPQLSIGMNKIGTGLAGGDWNVIKKILNDVFDDRTIKVWCI